MDSQSIPFKYLFCTTCEKEVRRKPAIGRDGNLCLKVFCNKDCYGEHRRKIALKRAKPCGYCGKIAPVAGGSGNASQKSHYCDKDCWKSAKKAKPKKCVNCKAIFTPVKWNASYGGFVSYNAGKTCSAECHNLWIRNNPERKAKISAAFFGDKHPNWQGGKSRMDRGYRGPNWKKQREKALDRDGGCCIDCGINEDESMKKYKSKLHVDHIVPYHNFNDYKKANKLDNLATRCTSCHRKSESKRSMIQSILPLGGNDERFGHRGKLIGSKCHSAKLSEHEVSLIKRKIREGCVQRKLANEYGVSFAAISSIANGHTWRHVT